MPFSDMLRCMRSLSHIAKVINAKTIESRINSTVLILIL